MNVQRSGEHSRSDTGFLMRLTFVSLALALVVLMLAASQAGAWQPPQPADAPAAPSAATVRGTVFNDLNGNGRQDTGEPGIPGVKISVYWLCSTGGVVRTDLLTDINGF